MANKNTAAEIIMHKIHQKKSSVIREVVALLLILFYPFNNTISDKILFGIYSPFVFLIIGIILLIPNLKKKLTITSISSLVAIIGILLYLAIGNAVFQSDPYNIRMFLIQVAYLLSLPFLFNVNIEQKSIVVAVTIFTIEHLIGTAFPIIAPSMYEKYFLSFICNPGNCFARNAFLTGRNAGITSHYSTNGAYMAIFSLFYSVLYLKEKDKKALLLTILALAALLIIGKRAHLLFVVLVIIVGYIVQKQNFKLNEFIKNNIKMIITSIVALISIATLSVAIPQINTTINRIIETAGSDDASSGRIPLYELAINEWQEKPILGNGWGHFIEASHLKFGKNAYNTDYMHTHNDYLEILCDKGIVGLLLYLILLIYLLFKSYKNRHLGTLHYFAFIYILFYILYGLTGTPISIPSNYCFLLISILIIKGQNNEKNRRNNF